jgi:transposase-like protein
MQFGGDMTNQLAQVGQFCPNEQCELYGEIEAAQIIRFGKTRNGTQRYRCKGCGQTFTETHGTVFYRRQAARETILETLALLAEGVRISSISRAKGIKEDTILDWLRAAARQAAEVEEALLKDYRISQAQIDGLWTYVGHKGHKGGTLNQTTEANSGAAR